MTNYEKIKAMSLVDMAMDIEDLDECYNSCICGKDCCEAGPDCLSGVMAWLESEVQE